MMTHTLSGREVVFAFIGRNHVAAVLPFKGDEGNIVYKIDDTWDSSVRKVGDYFILASRAALKQKEQKPSLTAGSLSEGLMISHPKYGTGQVLEYTESSQTVQVLFPETGVKKIAVKWLLENCLLQEERETME